MNDRRKDLETALREADWEALLPNLVAYAARRLRRVGWAAGRDEEPSKMSVEQLVNTAVEHCLEGRRTWDPDAVDLGGLLRGVIRSLTSAAKDSDVRRRTFAKPDVDEGHAIGASPEEEAIEEERRVALLASFDACVGDDPDLRALYEAALDGTTKRDEIAEALGWSADRVTAARIKLQRRLVSRAPEQFGGVRERRRRTS